MAEFGISIVEKGKRVPVYDLVTDLKEEVVLADLLKFVKRSLITIAMDVLREEQGRGFDKDPLTVVDGQKNRSIESVKPLGKIQFISRQNPIEAILFTYESIIKRSRVASGFYKDHNFVFFNGKEIARNITALNNWLVTAPVFKSGDKIRFVNVTPYAHKLELYGVRKGKVTRRMRKSKDREQRSGPVVRTPNGTYTLSYRATRAKYKSFPIKFEILPGNYLGLESPLPGRQFSGASWRSTYDPKGKYKRSGANYYLYPTILIYLDEQGMIQ